MFPWHHHNVTHKMLGSNFMAACERACVHACMRTRAVNVHFMTQLILQVQPLFDPGGFTFLGQLLSHFNFNVSGNFFPICRWTNMTKILCERAITRCSKDYLWKVEGLKANITVHTAIIVILWPILLLHFMRTLIVMTNSLLLKCYLLLIRRIRAMKFNVVVYTGRSKKLWFASIQS